MKHLTDFLPHLSNARILCIGDVMLDLFVSGDVTRISPEAPIPVLHVHQERWMVGGAGNVVRNISALGAKAHFMATVGEDEAGDKLKSLLDVLPNVQAYLVRDARRKTTHKSRYSAAGQQLLRVDHETPLPLSSESETQIISLSERLLTQVDVCIFSDYAKGLLTEKLLQTLTQKATSLGVVTIVDPKGRDYRRYQGVDWITPNRRELSDAVGYDVKTDTEIVTAAQELQERYKIKNILVTRSAEGVTLLDAQRSVHHLPVHVHEVFDVSGAGDTVVAVLGAALGARGIPLDAAILANIAGGIVVAKTGTASVSLDEIKAELGGEKRTDTHFIFSLEEASEYVQKCRLQGKIIGFTNGCFDLLHPGHISLLQQAKAACDVLIVGLNSDASVKRLKGEERPIHSETSRATVLAALSDVDAVVIFEEDTPQRLIEALHPDVLIKGADYTVERIVGADFVLSRGGRVVLAELEPGQSTTNTVKKLRG